MTTADEFRARMWDTHREAFTLHRDLLTIVERAIGAPRPLPDEVARATDMLMVQAYKAHASVYVLAVRGHLEDAATIVRRLLEIAVQVLHIGSGDDVNVCRERAGRYLARLWQSVPPEWREGMPDAEREAWADLFALHGTDLPRKPPTFWSLFEDIGQTDTYRDDYSLLSQIAHGAPPNLVQDYAQPTVPLRPDRFVAMVLVFATRYCLATLGQWNLLFHLVDDDALNDIGKRAMTHYAPPESQTPPVS